MPPKKCIDCGTDSKFDKIVAPVVVKPDIVSNKADIGCSITPENKYGKDPNIVTVSQPNVTTPNPSLRDKFWTSCYPT